MGIAGFYYVKTSEDVYMCRARGIFKKEGVAPLVGDDVMIGIQDETEGVVNEVLPRRNAFVRPPIANIDLFVAVVAAKNPAPHPGVLDRFLVTAEAAGVDAIVCVNKTDLRADADGKADDSHADNAQADDAHTDNAQADDAHTDDAHTDNTQADDANAADGNMIGAAAHIEAIYTSLYPTVSVSAKTGRGIEALKALIGSRRVAFAGPSGVGKSSLINRLLVHGNLITGEVSAKTGRGRHVTRHVEIFDTDFGASVYDTPGYTAFEAWAGKRTGFGYGEEVRLDTFFPEIARYGRDCRFDDCRHTREPGCAVTAALRDGLIAASRYASYTELLAEQDSKSLTGRTTNKKGNVK
jgi:ribosome biogenesis GTPase